VNSLSSVVPANGVDASGREGWERGSLCSCGGSVTLRIRRSSNGRDSEALEKGLLCKMGGRERKASAIFD
jgi:hypothetical protein